MYVCAFGLQSEAHRVRRVGKEEASFSLSLSLHPSRTSIRPSVRPSVRPSTAAAAVTVGNPKEASKPLLPLFGSSVSLGLPQHSQRVSTVSGKPVASAESASRDRRPRPPASVIAPKDFSLEAEESERASERASHAHRSR